MRNRAVARRGRGRGAFASSDGGSRLDFASDAAGDEDAEDAAADERGAPPRKRRAVHAKAAPKRQSASAVVCSNCNNNA